jgi:4-aminobutyrate aminotransferase
MALKLARLATGRHKTLSLWDSFHGASLDAISIGGEAVFRKGIGPLMPGTEHAPPCDPRACRFGCAGVCNARCAEYLDYVLGKEEDIGAVIIETIRCTDVQIPPPEYYRIVRDACDRHGALMILDGCRSVLGACRMCSLDTTRRPDMVVSRAGQHLPMAFDFAARLYRCRSRAGHHAHERKSVGWRPWRRSRTKTSTSARVCSANVRCCEWRISSAAIRSSPTFAASAFFSRSNWRATALPRHTTPNG